MGVAGLLLDGVSLAVVVGVFFRLGRLIEAVTGLKDRVVSLELWRDGFAPRPQI